MLPDYERPHIATVLARLNERPRRLISITGPRQSGKTTLIQQALRRITRPSRYIAADEPVSVAHIPWAEFGPHGVSDEDAVIPLDTMPDARWLVHNWEHARMEAKHSDRGLILVLDEIHYIRGWARTIKGLWDADRHLGIPLHVVLLGSAPLLVQAGLSEALTGRFEVIHLAHWSLDEMVAAFNVTLDEYIYFGGYPGAAALIGDELRWCSYIREALIEPTLDRDVLALERVDKPALLRQLFEVAAVYSGQIVAYTKLRGQLQDAGNTTTLARYMKLLAQVGLMRGLDKYAANEIRRRASKPKLQVLNTALLSAMSEYTFTGALSDRSHWGRLVESAVGAHLCNVASAESEIYYWREGDVEIDFVLRRGREVIGIEVKSGRHPGPSRGLGEFQRRFGAKRVMTVGTGGIPLQEFFYRSAQTLFMDP